MFIFHHLDTELKRKKKGYLLTQQIVLEDKDRQMQNLEIEDEYSTERKKHNTGTFLQSSTIELPSQADIFIYLLAYSYSLSLFFSLSSYLSLLISPPFLLVFPTAFLLKQIMSIFFKTVQGLLSPKSNQYWRRK